MLDDLRRSTSDDDDSLFEDLQEGDEESSIDEPDARSSDGRFMGMTAVERMFLSIFFFMNVLVLGLALLLATGRIRF